MVQLFQEQYCFQASPPDSRPQPVALLPLRQIQAKWSGLLTKTEALIGYLTLTTKAGTNLCTGSGLIDIDDAAIGSCRSAPFKHSFHITYDGVTVSFLARVYIRR